MADHSHVAGRESQQPSHLDRVLVLVEGHYEHRALALGKGFEAALNAIVVEPRDRRDVGEWEILPVLPKQLFPARTAAAQVEHDEAADAEDEGCQALRLAQRSRAQFFFRGS